MKKKIELTIEDAYCALVAEAGNCGATPELIKLVADKFDIEPWILEGYYFERLDDYEREAAKW